MYFLYILITIILLYIVTRAITIIIHELGHAIPAMILTKEKVTVYIGSYGDTKKSLHFSIGKLDLWLKYNIFLWNSGLCIPHAKEISFKKQFIYVLAGPLTSFLFASIACFVTFAFDLHGSLKLLFLFMMAFSIFDLYVNLIPKITIQLKDGSTTYNDGYILRQMFRFIKLPLGFNPFFKNYQEAEISYNNKNFKAASHQFHALLEAGYNDENIFRYTIYSYLQIREYRNAAALYESFRIKHRLTPDDLCNSAYVKAQLGNYEESLVEYKKALELNPNHLYCLNNIGYTLNRIKKYNEAIEYFDKAIKVDPTYAYSYNNRGLAKIKIGKIEEGLADINFSIQLDPANSYAYRNLGIYYLDRHEYGQALFLFNKSKELDESTHMIDELIKKAEMH